MTEHDQQLLDAVIGAMDKGISYEEAAMSIAGSAEAYMATIDRTLRFISSGNMELEP